MTHRKFGMLLLALCMLWSWPAAAQSADDLTETYVSQNDTLTIDHPKGWFAAEDFPGMVNLATSQAAHDQGCGAYPPDSLSLGIIKPTMVATLIPEIDNAPSLEVAFQVMVDYLAASGEDSKIGEAEYLTLAGMPALVFDMPYDACDGVRVLIDNGDGYFFAAMSMPSGELAKQKALGLAILDTLGYFPGGGGAAAVAARTPAAEPLLIFTEINEPQNPPVDSDFSPGQSNFTPMFFERLRDILIAEGFAPVFIKASDSEFYPDFFVPLDDSYDLPEFWKHVVVISPQSYGEDDWVKITPVKGYQFPSLPMGALDLANFARISAEHPESLAGVAKLSAGITLYTHYHCAEALPYLVEASTNTTLMADEILYAGVWFYRAGCEYDQGLTEDAITSYQAVLDFPYTGERFAAQTLTDFAAINLAWIYAQQDKTEPGITLLKAYDDFTYDTYEHGGETERFLKRADTYLALGEEEAAIAEITRLIDIVLEIDDFSSKRLAHLYTERGRRYWQTNQPELARADFDQAIQADAQYPKVYYWRGALSHEYEDFAAARADFEQFLALAPSYYDFFDEDLAPYMEMATTFLEEMTAQDSTQPFTGANDDWQPVVQVFEGTEMVLVPAGCFIMGMDNECLEESFAMCEAVRGKGICRLSWFTDEQPAHEQCLDTPFWIDRTEVTGAMYAACVTDGACTELPANVFVSRDTQPASGVTWYQASDYCAWRDARLPTEVEWAFAAAGPDSWMYPWGNIFVAENVVFQDTSDSGPADVGSRPGGESWVGALDMSGNVWEWVRSWQAPYPYDATDGREDDEGYGNRVLRSSGFPNPAYTTRVAQRTGYGPDQTDNDIGFRCARTYSPDDAVEP